MKLLEDYETNTNNAFKGFTFIDVSSKVTQNEDSNGLILIPTRFGEKGDINDLVGQPLFSDSFRKISLKNKYRIMPFVFSQGVFFKEALLPFAKTSKEFSKFPSNELNTRLAIVEIARLSNISSIEVGKVFRVKSSNSFKLISLKDLAKAPGGEYFSELKENPCQFLNVSSLEKVEFSYVGPLHVSTKPEDRYLDDNLVKIKRYFLK